MGTPLRVLIVDDSEDDCLLVLRAIRGGGYEPSCERVETADAMRAALRRQEWDCVISDYVIPGFGGLAAIRTLHEEGLDLPIVVVSGKIGETVAVEAMRAGAHDYVMKDNLARLPEAIARELREAEVRRERRRAEDLLAIAAHDVRNPLSVLQLQLQGLERMLPRGNITPEQLAQTLHEAGAQVKRATRFLENVLALTRLGAGRLRLRPEPTDLGDLVRELVRGTRLELERDGMLMRLRLEDSVVGHWDRGTLERIVSNLISNALKYGRGKPIDLRVSQRGDRALLSVRDQGIGIPAEALPRIFQRFERATREASGAGLGLWIVGQLVQALGGTLRVDSEQGVGSEFTLELPLGTPPAAAPKDPRDRSAPEGSVAHSDPAHAPPSSTSA